MSEHVDCYDIRLAVVQFMKDWNDPLLSPSDCAYILALKLKWLANETPSSSTPA